MCAVIRGEQIHWLSADNKDFYLKFFDQARYHGVEYLVRYLLKQSASWKDFPEHFKQDWMRESMGGRAHDIARSRDFIVLINIFQKADIPVLLLKGAGLAYTHYPEASLRTRVDTDIFIAPGDIQSVQHLLGDQGYELGDRTYKSHQFTCFKKILMGLGIAYDIHWRSSNGPEYARVISHDEGLRTAVPIPELNGCLTLAPEQALLLACMHRAGNPEHDPDRLIWLYDIHLLVSNMPEDAMVQFAQRAVKENIQLICLEGIKKAQSCFATRISDEVYDLLSMPAERNTLAQKFAGSYLGLIIDDLRILPDAGSRLGLVRELLFPPGSELLEKYQKQNVAWLPVLYLRYLMSGLARRLSLR